MLNNHSYKWLKRTRHIWLLSFMLTGVIAFSYFIPGPGSLYFSLSKPISYLSIIVALVALILEWRKVIVLGGIRQAGLAVILTAVFGVYFYGIALFYIATHAGV